MVEDKSLKNQPIVITGMHRSGTSLTASILQKAGVDIGRELLAAGKGNEIGHFEDVEFLSLHQEFLTSQGISPEGWTTISKVSVPEQLASKAKHLLDKRLKKPMIWGWKDPRTVLFLDFWHQLMPYTKFLFVYRSPWEVVDSLFTRGDPVFTNNPKFALEVWAAYNASILDFYTRNSECSLLVHTESLRDIDNTLIPILSKKLDVTLNSISERIYKKDAMHREINNTHRPALLIRYYPDVLELYKRINDAADLPAQSNIFEHHFSSSADSYDDWVFQDWLMSRRYLVSKQQTEVELQDTQLELQQSQSELLQTQSDLQQTQAELQHSESELQLTESELRLTESELQLTRFELQQAQFELQQSQPVVQQAQSSLQQSQTELQQTQAELQQTQAELHQTQSKLHQTQSKLQQAQSKLQQAQSELQQAQSGLQHTQSDLQHTQSELQKAQYGWRQTQSELTQAQTESESFQQIIQSMETSKFWKLRKNWFQLKGLIGLADPE